MKVIDIILLAAGAVIGVVLGGYAFGVLYPVLRASLGLSIAVQPGDGGGESIIPVGDLAVPYRMAGGLIDLIVFIAFLVAGALAVTGIIRAFRK